MGRGYIFSGLLHLSVLLLLVIGLPRIAADAMLAPPIAIEIVSFIEAPEPEPIAEIPPPEPKPLAEPEPEPEPEPIAEVEPEPVPLPEPEPEPEAEPEPEPEPEEEKVEAPPKPKPKPKPPTQVAAAEEKPEEPKEDLLTSILRNVDKLREQSASETPLADATPAPSQPQGSAIEQMTMVRAIQRQMARCWQIDPGARDAENLVVEIRVVLNPDASVRRVNIVNPDRMFSDAFYRSAAEGAKRAILRCSPFDLPHNKYEVWRDLTLRFDPSRVFGG